MASASSLRASGSILPCTSSQRPAAFALHAVGDSVTTVDLSLFQVVAGLTYALPRCTERALQAAPSVRALHAAVARRPRIAAYLQSPRRIPFNRSGIFRHYPELDA